MPTLPLQLGVASRASPNSEYVIWHPGFRLGLYSQEAQCPLMVCKGRKSSEAGMEGSAMVALSLSSEGR